MTTYMKKITFVWVLAFLLVQQLVAKPVDINKAKAFASQFIEVEGESLRSVQKTSSDEAPAYYIFKAKAGKGFVIVSGEDRLPLLMGYSDKGTIDQEHLPIQLKILLEQYSKAVARLRKTPDEGGFRSQKVFMHKPKIIVEALTKSKWGQSKPFNDLCPEITDGKRAVTGCVATAVAQLMYYHKWPKTGKGKHSYVPKRYGKALKADFSKHTYQWDLMKDEYKKQWVAHPTKPDRQRLELVYTKEEGEAIGRLLADVAISVDMDFGVRESGTVTMNALPALRNYFDYKAHFLRQEDAQGDVFLKTIKDELDAERPLVLSGQGLGGGHAWVIDGYDENDYLHCNWGWTGMSNGFFSLNLMSPTALGTGGGSGGFNSGQGILIARPNKDDDSQDNFKDLPLAFGSEVGLKLEMPNGKDKKVNFRFRLSPYFNFSKEDFSSKVGIGVYDVENTFINTISEQHKFIKGRTGFSYNGMNFYVYRDLKDYSDGTYVLRPIFKPNGSDDWEFIKRGNIIKIEIKNGQVSIKSDSHTARFRHTMRPSEEVQVYTNSTGRAMIELENLSSRDIESELGMKLKNLATQKTYSKMLDEIHLPAFGKNVLHPKYKLSNLNLPAGDYAVSFELYVLEEVAGTMKLVAKDIENPYGTFQIKVLDPASLPKLICKGFDVKQGEESLKTYHLSPELIEQGLFKFSSSIQNKGTITFDGRLTYRLKNLEDNTLTTLGEVNSLNISAGQEIGQDDTSIEVDMSSLNLADGTYRIELIADYNGNEISVWNADLEPYSFMTKDLAGTVVKKFKLKLAEAQEGGRLRFKAPLDNDELEHSFKSGTVVTLVSETAKDYELKEVLVDGKNIYKLGQPIKIVVEKNLNIEPVYAKKKVALPRLTAKNGSLTYADYKAGDLLELGTKITLEVRADEGYELAVLMHNGADIMDSKTFVLEDGNKIEVEFTKSLALNSLERSVEVYPNPATDYVILKGFTPNEEVYLLTMAGKTILSVKLDAEGSAKLKVSSLPRGLYLLRSETIIHKLQVR